jgi:hypothetical protein
MQGLAMFAGVVGRSSHNANRAIIFEGRFIRLSDTTVASQTEPDEIHA